GDTVSIKAALREAREAAPCLVASDEELTEAIVEAATAMPLRGFRLSRVAVSQLQSLWHRDESAPSCAIFNS
ncbi:hypothetical protein NKI14_32380, partial [Mesorhizobium sp. M0767]